MSPRPLSRRGLLGGGLALGGVAALAACGGSAEPGSATAEGASAGSSPGAVQPPAGPWTWTDDLDQEITLDAAPTRIAAYGDAAAALMNFGITPVAIFHYQDPATDTTFAGLDLDGIEVVGTAYGELDLERLAALAPDLFVTTTYSSDTTEDIYGFKDATQIATVRQLAPILGVLQAGSALEVIRTNERLVASLGVDVEDGPVAEDRARFEEVSAQLTEAAASGLTMMPIYAEDANLYYAKAPDDPALTMYADLGVQFVPVTGEDYYWEIVSWENADTYSPDIVLYGERDSYSPEQLLEQPVFAALPAAQAGQMHPWTFASMDYRAQAAYMGELAGWLGADRKVT